MTPSPEEAERPRRDRYDDLDGERLEKILNALKTAENGQETRKIDLSIVGLQYLSLNSPLVNPFDGIVFIPIFVT